MNINQFITEQIYEKIKREAAERSLFSLDRIVSEKGYNIRLRINSSFVKDDLAQSVWKGKNYLVHFSYDLTGHDIFTGHGHADAELKMLNSYKEFESYIEDDLNRYNHDVKGIFERKEEALQMSLF